MLKLNKTHKEKEKELMASEEKKTVDDIIAPKEKEVLRENVWDICMILPVKEGTIQGGSLVTYRVQTKLLTDIEFMTGVFRTMFATLAHNDPQLDKMFRKEFAEGNRLKARVMAEAKTKEKDILRAANNALNKGKKKL